MVTDILLLFVGVLAGIMNAVAGGGSLFTFPMLIAAGLPAISANATSYFAVLPGQVTAAISYRKHFRNMSKKYLWLLVPCIAGALIGSLALRHISTQYFATIVPWLVLLAVALFSVQPYLHNVLHRHLLSRDKPTKPLIGIGLAVFPLAIYGGFFGPGLGIMLLAFLSFTRLNRVHQINGLKNIAMAAMCLTTVIVLAPGSLINWHAAITMAIGSLLGGYLGAKLAQKVSSHILRIAVIAIGVAATLYLFIRPL